MTYAASPNRQQAILDILRASNASIGHGALLLCAQTSRATLNRDLKYLVDCGLLQVIGKGRSTQYRVSDTSSAQDAVATAHPFPPKRQWSVPVASLLQSIEALAKSRTEVKFVPRFLDNYIPNLHSFLPPQLALHLFRMGYCDKGWAENQVARNQVITELANSSMRLVWCLKNR